MQKLPHRCPATPDHHFLIPPPSRLMKTPQQRRNHMRILKVIVVTRPVQIRRHRTVIHQPVLLPVILTQLQSRNLRHRIRLVRRLQRTRQQTILRHRLRRQPGINTRTPQKQQPTHPSSPTPLNHVQRYRQVVMNEIRRVRAVRVNPTHLRRRHQHHIRPLRLQPSIHRRLIHQIQLAPPRRKHPAHPTLPHRPHQRRPHHAARPRNENFCFG